MQITALINKIKERIPVGWMFWAGMNRTDYNREKTVQDTMLMIIPRRYPVEWRPQCSYEVDTEFWFGKVTPILRSANQMQQHNPNEPVEAMQALHTTAEIFIANVNKDKHIQVLKCDFAEFFYASEGKSINAQYWLRVPVTLKLYHFAEEFDNILDFPLSNYDYTGHNDEQFNYLI
jgi:hypothetical protein